MFVQTQQQLLTERVVSLFQDDEPWPPPTNLVLAVISADEGDWLALPITHGGGACKEKHAQTSRQPFFGQHDHLD
jgi:hypothetical protein